MRSIVRPAAWALTAALLAPGAAHAQWDGPGQLPVLDMGPGILSQAQDAALRKSLRTAFAGAPTSRASGREARASLAYDSTPALRSQALEAFAGRAPDPQAAAAVRAAFSQHDYDRVYRGLIRPFGLAADDTADAMTAYLVLGWLIVNRAEDPKPAAVRAARDQIAEGLAAEPRYASQAIRAAAGEEFKLLFVATHAGWNSARKEGRLPAYEAGVARNFAMSGFDMKTLDLTGAGFQSR